MTIVKESALNLQFILWMWSREARERGGI